jgi:hypothetical protein
VGLILTDYYGVFTPGSEEVVTWQFNSFLRVLYEETR